MHTSCVGASLGVRSSTVPAQLSEGERVRSRVDRKDETLLTSAIPTNPAFDPLERKMSSETTPSVNPEATAVPNEAPVPPASSSNKPPKTARGRPTDDPDTRWSKTLSYILRHGAAKESLKLREDGFVKVEDLVSFVLSANFYSLLLR